MNSSHPGIARLTAVMLVCGCSPSAMHSRQPPDAELRSGYTRLPDVMPKPTPRLDLVFIIDTSPSMAPKREKLMKQIPRMLDGLKDPTIRALPSLRVAFLDGGTSGAISKDASAGQSGAVLGDVGALRTIGGLGCGLTDPAACWVQTATLSPANYVGDFSQVVTCSALGLGQAGSSYQQPLRALSIAATDSGTSHLREFLRQDAYLGLFIISDEDDCSAFSNSAMFTPELLGEAPNLRCATRGHACNGSPLPYPTTTGLASPLNACAARTDVNFPPATDFSQATTGTPLADIKAIAKQVKSLKPGDGQYLIFVSGMFGWPTRDTDPRKADYKIAPIPSSAASNALAPATVFDLWPVCYDPDHPPSKPDPTTGYDAVAAGFGAKPGLRLAAFIDEFGDFGLKSSICESDWSWALSEMAGGSGSQPRFLCIDQKIADADPSTPALEPDCIVELLYPKREDISVPTCEDDACLAPTVDDKDYTRTLIPRCPDDTWDNPCWRIVTDNARCRVSGQYLQLRGHMMPNDYVPPGTRVRTQCRFCPSTGSGVGATPGCSD